MPYSLEQVAKSIDHALLMPNLDEAALVAGCRQALEHRVASVCILPYFVGRCAELLAGSEVLATTTIGFPHGAVSTESKLEESRWAIDQGAKELDVVVNVSRVVSADYEPVRNEIDALVELCHARNTRLKIIFENCYLDREQKVRLCTMCGAAGVDWVKTSTGFGTSGATVEDVRLMREHSPNHVQVKASGGVRDARTLLTFLEIGATRVGSSQTVAILDEASKLIS